MFKKTTNSKLPAIAFALAVLAANHPTLALANDDVTKTEHVAYGDLNLASPEGIKTLDRRLDRAVKRVCGTGSGSAVDLQSQNQGAECEKQARADIAEQRSFAIAQATGQDHGKRWADNAAHNASPVTLSE